MAKKSTVLKNTWNPNCDGDAFLHRMLSDEGIRNGYIKAAKKAGDKPEDIKDLLIYFGCYK